MTFENVLLEKLLKQQATRSQKQKQGSETTMCTLTVVYKVLNRENWHWEMHLTCILLQREIPTATFVPP